MEFTAIDLDDDPGCFVYEVDAKWPDRVVGQQSETSVAQRTCEESLRFGRMVDCRLAELRVEGARPSNTAVAEVEHFLRVDCSRDLVVDQRVGFRPSQSGYTVHQRQRRRRDREVMEFGFPLRRETTTIDAKPSRSLPPDVRGNDGFDVRRLGQHAVQPCRGAMGEDRARKPCNHRFASGDPRRWLEAVDVGKKPGVRASAAAVVDGARRNAVRQQVGTGTDHRLRVALRWLVRIPATWAEVHAVDESSICGDPLCLFLGGLRDYGSVDCG